jgi:hypothetical protein
MCQQERARSTSSPGLTAQQFQHERRKSLFAIRQRYLIDQHTLYSSGSLHGGGDANRSRVTRYQQRCLQRLSAANECRHVAVCPPRRNLHIQGNLPPSCKQRMLRGFDAAQHRHRHRDPSRRVQRMTCMAQTHLHLHVSTPRRLSSQTQVAMCERTTSTRHYLSHARFLHRIPHYRAAMAGRNSKTADDDTLYKRRHSVRSCVLFLPGRHAQTVSEASLVFPDKARHCSETLRRTHPPPAITIAGMMKGLP